MNHSYDKMITNNMNYLRAEIPVVCKGIQMVRRNNKIQKYSIILRTPLTLMNVKFSW